MDKLKTQLKKYVSKLRPLLKHHYFFVTIVLFSAVAFAIFTVNQTLSMSTDGDYRDRQLQSTVGGKFNQAAKDTINKIKSLQRSTDASNNDTPFPPGRINPFAE